MGSGIHPVIVAGGRGTRLWPLSRRHRPKPFLSPDGGPTLLERAWGRARRLAPAERILVAAEATLGEAVARALPDLRRENLLLEPVAKDTGPAAAHAAWAVERREAGAIMAFLPADHLVEDEARFVEAISEARRVAVAAGALVCLGVTPAGASSAYGYVECDRELPGHGRAAKVARFVEKPDAGRARELLASGRCLWNAGIFVWEAARFLDEAAALSPEMGAALRRLRETGDAGRFFGETAAVPVDRAVMERTSSAWVVEADMGWDDLGGWEALARHLPADADGNFGPGVRVALDSRGCVVHSPSKPVVLLGVTDLVIAECDDVLYVARRADAERTREVPGLLRRRGLEDRT